MPPTSETTPNALDKNGTAYHDPAASQHAPEPWLHLTVREREVAVLLARGDTCREIATALGLSVKTVDTHRMHVLKKLGLSNTVKLAIWLFRAGITVWS